MRIVFFGNADFGVDTLKALISSKSHDVVGVVTNEDKKVGRNRKIIATPIKKIALDNNVDVLSVDDISNRGFLTRLRSLKADIFIVIGTSLNVYPAASLLNYAANAERIIVIDLQSCKHDGVEFICDKATNAVPNLVEKSLTLNS